jgi:hypothetical protein
MFYCYLYTVVFFCVNIWYEPCADERARKKGIILPRHLSEEKLQAQANFEIEAVLAKTVKPARLDEIHALVGAMIESSRATDPERVGQRSEEKVEAKKVEEEALAKLVVTHSALVAYLTKKSVLELKSVLGVSKDHFAPPAAKKQTAAVSGSKDELVRRLLYR